VGSCTGGGWDAADGAAPRGRAQRLNGPATVCMVKHELWRAQRVHGLPPTHLLLSTGDDRVREGPSIKPRPTGPILIQQPQGPVVFWTERDVVVMRFLRRVKCVGVFSGAQ